MVMGNWGLRGERKKKGSPTNSETLSPQAKPIISFFPVSISASSRNVVKCIWQCCTYKLRVPDKLESAVSFADLFMALERVSEKRLQAKTFCSQEFLLTINWDDLSCPICLDFPHNGVLLQCSSYENGCRAFLCNTDHLHSNCLDRFISACGTQSPPPPLQPPSKIFEETCKPVCPLCRGQVTGWIVVEEARVRLDDKKRCCEEQSCTFMGTYTELRKHALSQHPDSRPSQIDPARKLDWENFQQSSEIIDVLSTIHSEVPRGVVLGDYVIEYGDDDTADEFEDVPSNEGNWWTSCILYQMFDNIRNARNRRRSRMSEGRRGSRRSSYDNSNSDDSSVASVEFPEYRVDEIDDEFISTSGANRSSAMHQSSRRRRSRFYEN